jgi:hypothetical protein
MKWNEQQIAAIQEIADASLPGIRSSALVISVLSGNVDPQLCLQIGAALLMDKPLILTAVQGAWIPARLRQLADVVIEGGSLSDPEMREKLQAAIQQVMTRRPVV